MPRSHSSVWGDIAGGEDRGRKSKSEIRSPKSKINPNDRKPKLIALMPGRSMSAETYLDMCDELSALFGGRKIDLVQKRLLKNPFRRHEILTTREVVYAA